MSEMDPKVRKGLDDLLCFVAKEIEKGDAPDEQDVIELAAQMQHEEAMEALMAGEPQPTEAWSEYLRLAGERLEASE